jgi:predicted PurR-regulated permease PerM
MPLFGGVTGTFLLISSIVGAGATVAGSVDQAAKTRLQREYEANFRLLSESEQKAVDKKLREAKDLEAKRQVLIDTLSNSAITRIKNIQENKAATQKTTDTLLIVGSVAIVLILAGFLLYKSDK